MRRPGVTLAVAAGLAAILGAAGAPDRTWPDPPDPPAQVEVFTDCPDCPQMVPLKPGAFMMGSTPEEQHWYGVPRIFADEESPRHKVTIGKAFAVSRNEVTYAQYARFVQDTGRKSDPKGCSMRKPNVDVWAYLPELSWRNPGVKTGPDYPVNCVSWLDAKAYAAWLSQKTGQGYRLPTEAEWEYAARGGTTTAAYWGDTSENMCARANVMTSATYIDLDRPVSWRNRLMCSGEHTFTVPVGSYPPNPFGLNDMIGNVWEWVEDCSHNNYIGAPRDGSAWIEPGCPNRTLRGGGLHSAPFFGRAATRESGQIPDHLGIGVGIRVARDLTGPRPALTRIVLAQPIVGDPVAGEALFAHCTKCHNTKADQGDRSLGPNLNGLFGKAAGTNRPYPYSAPLKASGIVWNTKTLDVWIKDPAAMVPHNQMTFVGQPDAKVRADIIAYMEAATK